VLPLNPPYDTSVQITATGAQYNDKSASEGARAQRTLIQRRLLLGSALLVGGALTWISRAQGEARTTVAEPPSQGAERLRTSLHQEVDFKSSAQRIYEALLDSKQFSAFSGEPAHIDRRAGGAFFMFAGKIVGRNIELVRSRRIVQAWRLASWNEGVYSIVKFELKERATETRVLLDHTGFPEGAFDHLNAGWRMRYWDPLGKFIA
jgi:activator of HSP90 ATPase